MSRSVIIACSQTKRRDVAGELAAIALYDGPAWRVLRTNLTCSIAPPLALSAQHGLISAYQEIADYDRKLDGPRVVGLIDKVAEQLVGFIGEQRIRGPIFAYGGRYYRSLLEQSIQLAEMELNRDIPVTYSSGGIGEQLGQLKAFLQGKRL